MKGERRSGREGKGICREEGVPEGMLLLLDSVDESSMEDRATGACQRRTAV